MSYFFGESNKSVMSYIFKSNGPNTDCTYIIHQFSQMLAIGIRIWIGGSLINRNLKEVKHFGITYITILFGSFLQPSGTISKSVNSPRASKIVRQRSTVEKVEYFDLS